MHRPRLDDEGDDRAPQGEVGGDQPITDGQPGRHVYRAAPGEAAARGEHRQTDADLDESEASGIEALPPGQLRHHGHVAGAGRSGEQHQQITETRCAESAALREQPDPDHRDHRRAQEPRREPGALSPPLEQRSHDDGQGDDQPRVGRRGHGEPERLKGEDRAEDHPEHGSQDDFGTVEAAQPQAEYGDESDCGKGESDGEKPEDAIGRGDVLGRQITRPPDDRDAEESQVDMAVGGHAAMMSGLQSIRQAKHYELTQ